MKPLGFLFIIVMLFSCKAGPDSSGESQAVKTDNASWPKSQREVENIHDYYDQTQYISASIKGGELAVKKNGKWSIIDAENNLYFPFDFDTLVSNMSSVALKRDGSYEIYDTSRTLVAEIRSDDLTPIFHHFYLSRKKDLLALVNPNGMLVSEHNFDEITGPKDESYFLGRQGKEWGAYDMAGQKMDSTSRALEAVRWLKDYRVALKSYGPMNLGMNKKQIEKAIGWELNELYSDEFCYIYNLGDDFLDIQLMINSTIAESMTLERIYIFTPNVRTKSGIGNSSTREELINAYGSKIEARVNTYDEGAEDLFYVPTDRRDKNYRLNFLCRNNVIESYSIGRLPSINFVEGCL